MRISLKAVLPVFIFQRIGRHLNAATNIYPFAFSGPVEPQFGPGRYIYFEGFSVDEHGKQHYMDATVAYRQTCLRAIEYLRRYGYSDYQIYLLLGCAPVQGHVAGIVDVSLFGMCVVSELTGI